MGNATFMPLLHFHIDLQKCIVIHIMTGWNEGEMLVFQEIKIELELEYILWFIGMSSKFAYELGGCKYWWKGF